MALFKWNDVYCKTLKKQDNQELKVKVSACKDKDGKIASITSQLRYFSEGKPTETGISFNVALLNAIWKQNADHHRTDGWIEETSSHKISVAFGKDHAVTIAVCRHQKSSAMTLDYETFRHFVEIIPTLKFIIAAICTEKKDEIATQVLRTILTSKIEDANQRTLELEYKEREEKVANVAWTLGIPLPLLLAALWNKEFIEDCKRHMRNLEESEDWKHIVNPIIENECIE